MPERLNVKRRSWPFGAIPFAGFESSRRLLRWLAIGSAIGVVAGLGAVVFARAIELVTHAGLGAIVGFHPPPTQSEGVEAVSAIARPWLLPIVTGLGGLVSGIIVFGLAPEAEGHGTDAAIEAFHRRGGWIRPRIPIVKLVASAITIGSGGSAGREGPAAQISAGFGSLLGHALLKDPQERRIAVAAGIGAGIGAIFKAPLGGAVLAAEILYLHDIEVEAIIPSLIAAIVGYTVYGAWYGFDPIFGAHPFLQLGPPIQLLYYAVLGIACGVGGLLYARTFYGTTDLFRRVSGPRWAKPALGGAIVGLVGIWMPQILHTGYGWVQIAMTREGVLAMSPLVLLVLPLAKIVATSLSIGSGGSGGIFGPGMVIGGVLGAALWRAAAALGVPALPPQPAPFVIIGMMAFFGGIAHAPLAVMLMVAEMTGTLSLLAPAMIAVAISTAIVGDATMYRAQLRDRATSPFHRARFALPLLAHVRVRAATEPAPVLVPESASVSEALDALHAARAAKAVVTTAAGAPVGGITREALERVSVDGRTAPVSTITARITIAPDQSLEEGIQALTAAGVPVAPVVEDGRTEGLVTTASILRAYRDAIPRSDGSVRDLVHLQ